MSPREADRTDGRLSPSGGARLRQGKAWCEKAAACVVDFLAKGRASCSPALADVPPAASVALTQRPRENVQSSLSLATA